MRKSQAQLEFLDAMIQQLLVVRPDMSLEEMSRHLEENGRHIGDLHFLAKRRDKVLRRAVAKMNRATKMINAAEFNATINQTIEALWKIANSNTTSPGVKNSTLKNIAELSHRRLMTFTLLNIFNRSELNNSIASDEKEFPEETFDVIMEAINNNQLKPRTGAFQYLPDSQIDPSKNKTDEQPKPDIIEPAERPKFFTTVPLKNDRSFVVPPRHN